MKYKACFLVSAPLHLLNAIEARKTLLSDSDPALLVVMRKEGAASDVFKLASRFEGGVFDECVYVSLKKPAAGYDPIQVVRALIYNIKVIKNEVVSKCQCSEIVFVGNILNQEMLSAAISSKERVIVLDDGTSTSAYLEARGLKQRHNWLGVEYPGSKLQCYVKSLVARLFYGNIDNVRLRPTFFTLYADKAKSVGCEAIENRYAFIKTMMAGGVIESRCDFLGAPFVDRGELSWEDYCSFLSVVVDKNNMKFRYVAHWAESDEVLSRISETFLVECVRLDYPYELEYVLSENKPELIGGWFSSAFDVLEKIKKDATSLACYKIPVQKLFSESIRASAVSFYSRHEKSSSIRLVDLSYL